MFRTIRSRLLALVLLAIAPSSALIGTGLLLEWRAGQADALQRVVAEARAIAKDVDDHVASLDALLIGLSRAVSPRKADTDANDALLRQVVAELPPYISSLQLFALDGSNIGQSTTSERFYAGDRAYFRQVLAGARLAVGTAVRGRQTGQWVVTLARPVEDKAGRLQAVVSVGTRLEPFHDVLSSHALHAEALIRIVDEQGIVLAHTAKETIGSDLSALDQVPRHRAAKEAGEAVLWADNVERITGSSTPRRVPWLVSVGLPTNVAFAAVSSHLAWGALVSLTVLLIALSIAWMLSGRIVRPLQQLGRDASMLAAGELKHRSTVERRDEEVGILAHSFNQMASALERRQEDERQARETLAAVIDSSPVAIVCLAPDKRVLVWSRSAERIFGYSAAETIGQPYKLVPPGQEAEFEELVRRALAGEELQEVHVRRQRKDGALVDIRFAGAPLYDSNGTVRGVAYALEDITERKKADLKLQVALNSMRQGFLMFDSEGRLVLCNERYLQMYGLSPRTAQPGCSLRDLLLARKAVGTFAGDPDEYIAQSVNRGKVATKMVTLPDDRTVLVSNAAAPDGGWVSTHEDITEKLATEAQFHQAQKMEAVGQLTGGIAHDFNNMLTVIMGTSEILAEEVANNPELGALAKMIDRAAQQGADLTKSLLSFARKQPLRPQEADINGLMADTVKLLQSSLGEHIDIETKFANDAWPALVDASQLSSALLNLAVNARDAMPDGGKLTLETGNAILDENYVSAHQDVQPGSYVMIAVSDTGIGMPAEIRDKVFEPFFTTKEEGKGTGLGLSMVYGFVKQSGGHIKVYSEKGHGTTIKLYLPRAGIATGRDQDDLSSAPLQLGMETILVVEDNELVRNQVTAQLERMGYTTLHAANAKEALALLDEGVSPDLLFTDVIMPGAMNGRQLAEEAVKRRPALKVLYTSGYTENAMIHQGRLERGVHLLVKPYRNVDLARMVRIALGNGPVAQTTEAPRIGKK